METFTSTIAGSNFRHAEAKAALDNCVVGDTMRLERDPHNEYDMNAIKLMLEDDGQEHFVGFVARKDNQHLAELMDLGEQTFEAVISVLDASGKRNHVITISEVPVGVEEEDEDGIELDENEDLGDENE